MRLAVAGGREALLRHAFTSVGAGPPVPPGLDRLPGPGVVAASPAMRGCWSPQPTISSTTRVTMTIGDAGLAHENELVALIGRTPDQLRAVRSVPNRASPQLAFRLPLERIVAMAASMTGKAKPPARRTRRGGASG
ncbi:MAG TPA: hypothetical protein VFY84_21165 [Jiangellales bacterium]|nr:hypothetical protein [Jiangellales bacterium]